MNPNEATLEPDPFVRRVRDAATGVLGGSPTGDEIRELCRGHEEARWNITQDRAGDAIVVAIVGATGQGKSWLTRQLIQDPSVASAIRSGNNLDEATEKLTWIGPRPPSDLDSRREQYLACDASKMQSIGFPYLIVDAPGATDDRQAIASVAERALSMASVLILVVRRDQLRSQRVSGLATASEGTIVIPVVNMAPVQKKVANQDSPAHKGVNGSAVDDDLRADVETLVSRLREVAPQSKIELAVIVTDFEISDRGEEAIGREAAATLGQRIEEAISENADESHRRGARLAALDQRFTAAVASVLKNQLPELTAAVQRLNVEARRLPTQVAGTLLGGEVPLRAAIRGRLRIAMLSETAALFFPYRTILSVLNLTHGAWDRMLLSFSGSIPSLVGAVYTSVQNISGQREAGHDLRHGLRQRASAAVADRLEPMAIRFRGELESLRNGGHASVWTHPGAGAGSAGADSAGSGSPLATLSGIDALQEGSQSAFDSAIEEGGVGRTFAIVCGVIGTVLFWSLMAGPLVALYRSYLGASAAELWEASGGGGGGSIGIDPLDRFPRPNASMLLTSLALSLLPTAIFAMIVLSICQSRRRIDSIATSIRNRHDQMIADLQRGGVLRLRWSDPLLADAEFLLSIGRSSDSDRGFDSPSTAEASRGDGNRNHESAEVHRDGDRRVTSS